MRVCEPSECVASKGRHSQVSAEGAGSGGAREGEPIALPLDRKMNACVAPAANVFISAVNLREPRATPLRELHAQTERCVAQLHSERGMWQLGLGSSHPCFTHANRHKL